MVYVERQTCVEEIRIPGPQEPSAEKIKKVTEPATGNSKAEKAEERKKIAKASKVLAKWAPIRVKFDSCMSSTLACPVKCSRLPTYLVEEIRNMYITFMKVEDEWKLVTLGAPTPEESSDFDYDKVMNFAKKVESNLKALMTMVSLTAPSS